MTCIAAIVEPGRVWMGGDSAVSFSSAVLLQAEPKVFKRGPIIVGCCGNATWESMWQRLEFDPPGDDIAKWVKTKLSDALKEAIKKLPTDGLDEVDTLIGVGGNLYTADSEGIPWRIRNSYYAIGSSSDSANGSLYESEKRKRFSSPRKRILSALKAAEHHTNCVRPPFHVIHT